MEHDERTEFLTPQQAAKLLNLPTHKVLRMIHRKKLRAVKLGTRWRIPKSALTKLIPRSI